ncbi:Callose synthase 9 isoform B [Glycine soja]|uniref:Callose synthase 9 isoform A n=1 Tax=Glycine soja TaxID=3848 RepID=A0A445IUW7_GLYSO|nr:Callose synthase 9 isoform A [Glycine soja]RZB89764.1 Callose synthase 9 isoform B [Glycine soja]
MSRAEEHWERLVRAALRRERTGDDAYGRPVGGIAGNVPSALAKNRDIDEILRVADEIEDDDPNISRILCEHAYSLSQNLDPNSEGRGVLQFKTGLMSVIKNFAAWSLNSYCCPPIEICIWPCLCDLSSSPEYTAGQHGVSEPFF